MLKVKFFELESRNRGRVVAEVAEVPNLTSLKMPALYDRNAMRGICWARELKLEFLEPYELF